MSSGRFSQLLLLGALGACSASAPPPPPASAPVQAAPMAGPSGPVEPPDLSPVPAPSGLVAVGRWRSPGRTLDTLVGWSNLPLDWRRMLGAAAPGTPSLVAFDAPVEVALVLERTGGAMPDLARVLSVGLTSFEQARGFAEQRGWTLSRLGPDVYGVQGLPDAHCVLGRALGTAPVRLVCSDRQRDVERYWP